MMRPTGCPRLVASAASRSLGPSSTLQTLPSRGVMAAAFAKRQIPSCSRQISFSPWRRESAPKDLPVYFPASKVTAYQSHAGWQVIRRVLLTGVVCYLCVAVYLNLVIYPLFDFLEQEYDNLPDEDKKQIDQEMDEDDGVLFFLPMPFTTTTVPAEPYKSTDPEWAMFLKLNKDQEDQKLIKGTLAEIVRRLIASKPQFNAAFGGPDIKVRRMWLDIIYPAMPSPAYHVSGLILADDGLFWGRRELHPAAGSRVVHIFAPKAVARALWVFASTLSASTAQNIATFMGFKPNPAPVTWDTEAMRGLLKQNDALNGQAGVNPAQRGIPGNTDREGGGSLRGDDSTRLPGFREAVMAGSKEYWKARKVDQPSPRGSVKVEGMLELQGKRANMALYVQAAYDPVRREYVSLQVHIKHLLPHKQSPAR